MLHNFTFTRLCEVLFIFVVSWFTSSMVTSAWKTIVCAHIHLLLLLGLLSVLTILVVWFFVFCPKMHCFNVLLLQLWLSSQRDQLQQSDPPPKLGTLSLSPTKAELTRKQNCGTSSWLKGALLFSQAVHAHTGTHTHTYISPTHRHCMHMVSKRLVQKKKEATVSPFVVLMWHKVNTVKGLLYHSRDWVPCLYMVCDSWCYFTVCGTTKQDWLVWGCIPANLTDSIPS